MNWKPIEAHEVTHIWKDSGTRITHAYHPSWYEHNGTPSGNNGRDMKFLYAEVEKEKVDNKDIVDVWRETTNQELHEFPPNWYQDNGTPVGEDNIDMVFLETKIKDDTLNCVFVLVGIPSAYMAQARRLHPIEVEASKIRKSPRHIRELQLAKLRKKKQQLVGKEHIPGPHNIAIFLTEKDAHDAIQKYSESISDAGYHSHFVIEPVLIGYGSIGTNEPTRILAQKLPLKEVWYSRRTGLIYKKCEKPKSIRHIVSFSS